MLFPDLFFVLRLPVLVSTVVHKFGTCDIGIQKFISTLQIVIRNSKAYRGGGLKAKIFQGKSEVKIEFPEGWEQ